MWVDIKSRCAGNLFRQGLALLNVMVCFILIYALLSRKVGVRGSVYLGCELLQKRVHEKTELLC